jgi:hypothetical protein
MRWVEKSNMAVMINEYRILVGNPEGKPRRRRDEKVDLQATGSEDVD